MVKKTKQRQILKRFHAFTKSAQSIVPAVSGVLVRHLQYNFCTPAFGGMDV